MGWLLFGAHLLVDIAVIWYVREMLIRFNILSEGFDDITTVLEEYEGHVDKISKMEAYFGDETILRLLQHSVETKNFLNEFSVLFSLDDKEGEAQYAETDDQS
jgi:2-hydroxy-3-keto-5-methylthiopentenyl-1-phosphate phosphatase